MVMGTGEEIYRMLSPLSLVLRLKLPYVLQPGKEKLDIKLQRNQNGISKGKREPLCKSWSCGLWPLSSVMACLPCCKGILSHGACALEAEVQELARAERAVGLAASSRLREALTDQ